MGKVIVFTHPDCLLKDNGSNHPEKQERLAVVLKAIQSIGDVDTEVRLAPLATNAQVSLVHPESHLREIFSMIPDSGLDLVQLLLYSQCSIIDELLICKSLFLRSTLGFSSAVF